MDIAKLKQFVDNRKKDFIPWESPVPVSWKVFDEKELSNMIEAVMDCHWTEWRWNDMFEKKLAEFIWTKFIITTNSWSSANLLAMTALTAKELWDRQMKKWDEVITVAAGFPTTITPIIQNGFVPVFVDVDLETYNINIDQLKLALSDKTKAIFIAHTLWNPFNLWEIVKICKEHNIWLIEDNCDALGSMYEGKYTWNFWDICTFSFYPAHHITMGEGWALGTNNPILAKVIRSFRDWWRDCWCRTGEDNSCRNRFGWQLGQLPKGFDHKYTYSRLWYNLKITDIQAALGVAQLEKLDKFIAIRKDNFEYLYNEFIKHGLDKYFILPKSVEWAQSCRFWFLLSIKEWVWFSRESLVKYLNDKKIGTRLLFAGNYTKQPAFLDYVKEYRIIGDLKNTDYIMNNTFRLGVFQGLTKKHLDYIILCIKEFVNGK